MSIKWYSHKYLSLCKKYCGYQIILFSIFLSQTLSSLSLLTRFSSMTLILFFNILTKLSTHRVSFFTVDSLRTSSFLNTFLKFLLLCFFWAWERPRPQSSGLSSPSLLEDAACSRLCSCPISWACFGPTWWWRMAPRGWSERPWPGGWHDLASGILRLWPQLY